MVIGITVIRETGSKDLGRQSIAANITAAALLSFFGVCFPACRRAVAHIAPQQLPPVLSPHLRQFGGASHLCRRFLWRKSRNTVAAPVLPAAHFGDNFAFFANYCQPFITEAVPTWILTA